MGAPVRLAAFSLADCVALPAGHQLLTSRFPAPQGSAYFSVPGEYGRVTLPRQLLLRLLSRRPESAALVASRSRLRTFPAELERAPGCFPPSSHALRRSEDLLSGAS